MPQFSNISLAILAGGKASRMGGKNKALLEINGQTFISRIHQNLSPLFSSTIIVSNEIKDFRILKVSVFSDIFLNKGPLGGIHSALVNSAKQNVFIVSCDMPFADPSIAEILVKEFIRQQPDILIPVIDGYKEPLFGIYSKSIILKAESLLSGEKGKPITDLLEISNTVYFDLQDNAQIKKSFININSMEDLERLSKIR